VRRPASVKPQTGTRVGRYVLKSKVGQGGMAEVWAADDPHLSRVVAVKLVLDALDKDDKALKRFVTEARALAALEHPHILPVYDFGEEEGRLFIVMPLVKGGTLTTRMKDPTPPETALPWLRALASALDFAHARRVIHRDVKPGNVLFDEFGKVLLNDFGIAKREGEDLTTKGGFVGTFGFMPPEQMLGQDLDGTADQYSLGVVAFQLLTASFPFPARTMSELVERAFKQPPASAHKAWPALPPDVDKVFLKVLAKKAPDRYRSCLDFVEALEACTLSPSARMRAMAAPEGEDGGTEVITAEDLRRLTVGARSVGREPAPAVPPPPPRPRSSAVALPPVPPSGPPPAPPRARSGPVEPVPPKKRVPSLATAPILHPRAAARAAARPRSEAAVSSRSGPPVWVVALAALLVSVGLVFVLVKFVIQPAEEKKSGRPKPVPAAPRPAIRPVRPW